MHAGRGKRGPLVDRDNARGGMRATHKRDMARAGECNIGRETTLAGDEAAILAHAAIGRDITEGAPAHGVPCGWFRPRMRSAASAIASTIWA